MIRSYAGILGYKHPMVSAGAAFVSATGGTVTTDGDFKIHTFDASADFIVSVGGDVSVFCVGGGAGGNGGKGGSHYGAGGAGGTVRYVNAHTITAQTYAVQVGIGSETVRTGTPANGGSSVFDTITATGGIGKINTSANGGDNADYNGGTGAPGAPYYTAGGGAGAGGNGVNAGAASGNGGIGVHSSISGTDTGYGGGGPGSADPTGGTGTDGGAPTSPSSGVSGINGLGGGASGGVGSNVAIPSGKWGGRGVVIIRYRYK